MLPYVVRHVPTKDLWAACKNTPQEAVDAVAARIGCPASDCEWTGSIMLRNHWLQIGGVDNMVRKLADSVGDAER